MTDHARISFARYNRTTKDYDFTDAMWRKADPYRFNIVKRLRAAVAGN